MRLLSALIFSLCISAVTAEADYARVYTVEGDLSDMNQQPFALPLVAGTTPTIEYRIKKGGMPYTQTTGWTGVLWFAESDDADYGMVVTNESLSSGRSIFSLDIHETATPGDYFAQFMFYGPGGKIEEWHRGTLELQNGGVTGPWTPFDWNFTNTWSAMQIEAKIEEAVGEVEIDGDVTGVLSNVVVAAIRGRNVGTNAPASGQALVWNGSAWVPGTVSSEGGGGTQESDLIKIQDTNVASAIGDEEVGFYRKQLTGGQYGTILNVGGSEIGYIDENGLTLWVGSLSLFEDDLTANLAAYDGSKALPSITFDGDRTRGFYRFSTNSSFSVGAAAAGVNPFWFDETGLFVRDGDFLKQDDRLRINRRDIARTETFLTGWSAISGSQYITANGDTISGSLSGGVVNIGTNGNIILRLSSELAGYDITATLSNTTLSISGYDNGSWISLGDDAAVSLTNAVYTRIKIEADPGIPPPGGSYGCAVSQVVTYCWTYPDSVGDVQETAGIRTRADVPVSDRDVSTKEYVDDAVDAVTPAAWSAYPATADVNMDGNKILLGGGWSLLEESGVGIVSFDAWGSTNGLVIANNGTTVISAQSGLVGLAVDSFSLDGSNAVVFVSTNNHVEANPIIQYTDNLVVPDWETLDQIETSYPAVTNDAYRIEFYMPDGSQGFIRAVKESGAAKVTIHSKLYLEAGVNGGWIPTSTNGLIAGDFWVDGATVKVMP